MYFCLKMFGRDFDLGLGVDLSQEPNLTVKMARPSGITENCRSDLKLMWRANNLPWFTNLQCLPTILQHQHILDSLCSSFCCQPKQQEGTRILLSFSSSWVQLKFVERQNIYECIDEKC